MSELKTLKDFGDEPCMDVAPGNSEGRKRLKEELRDAAQEWVLDLQESIGGSTGDYTDVEDMEREAQIEWIETFFNLEDDD